MRSSAVGEPISNKMISGYLKALVNRFFKILPIRESGEKTLPTYIKSLQAEILGCKDLIIELNNDADILSLVSILQFFIDNPDCPVGDVKREVFRAINICNRLQNKFVDETEGTP